MPESEKEKSFESAARRKNLAVAAMLFVSLSAMWTYSEFRSDEFHEAVHRNQATSLIESSVDELERRVALRLTTLSQIQKIAREDDVDLPFAFSVAARMAHAAGPEFLAINRIDASRRIVQVWPEAANRSALGQTVGRTAEIVALLDRAAETDEPRVTGLVDLFQGGRGIAVYFPIRRNGEFAGFINGVFRIDGLESLMKSNLVRIRSLRIVEGGGEPRRLRNTELLSYSLPILDRTLKVEFAADPDGHRNFLFWLELAFGLVLALGCSVLVFFGLDARRARARNLAMLSGILTSAPDAIVTLDEDQRIIVYTPAAARMFGHDPAVAIGASIDLLLPESARAAHARHVEEFLESGDESRQMGNWRVVRGLRANGELFPVMAQIARTRFEGRTLMTAILRDMSDAERMNEQLRKLAEERARETERAQDASRAKTMFLATMSHELRTPLNAIIGFSDAAIREIFGPLGHPKYKEYLADIKRSGEDLLGIVDSVLDFSKMEVGAFKFERVAFDLSEILALAVRQIAPLVDAKGLAIEVRVTRPLGACGDPRATRQIATNLLSNAIKFTEAGRVIVTASACADPNFVEFVVADTGIGMSAEQLSRVGQPFVQVGDVYRSEVKGTGLGLATARSFAKSMGGDVEIASAPGKGTTVRVRLPAHCGGLESPPVGDA